MTSKRFGNFQLKQPSAAYKKARLDIDIIPSQQYIQQTTRTTAVIKNPTTVAKSSSKTDVLWGDEDDEFIILASQAVEEVEMSQQSHTNDVTFGRFGKGTVSSSTQSDPDSSELMPPPTAVPGPSRVNPVPTEIIDLLTDDDDVFSENFDENYDNIEKHIDEFFNNEFDDDFNLDGLRSSGSAEKLVEQRNEQPVSPKKSSPDRTKPVNVESKPSTMFRSKQPQAKINDFKPDAQKFTQNRLPATQQQLSQAQAKQKDHAKDMQVKFLTNQLEMASKKTDKLQTDYNDVLERIQIRDGEVSMLRYELKNIKSQNEQLRLEKMKESETIKREWVEKMKNLEKVIIAQKADLEFKTAEISNSRMKRLSNSFRIDKRQVNATEQTVTEDDLKAHSRRLRLFENASQSSYEIDPRIFEISAESISKYSINNGITNFFKRDAILSQHLGHLQTCLSQMIASKSSLPCQTVRSIATTASQSFLEIQQYCNKLQMVRVKDVHMGAKVAFEFLCRNSKKNRLEGCANIYQREPISSNEKAIISRRLLAALSLLCRYLPSLALNMVQQQKDVESSVSVLNKSLIKMSYANELYDHFGMIAAAAAFLCSLTHHMSRFQESGCQVMNLLKSLVQCRPDSALILTYISEAIYRISSQEHSIHFLNNLCWRSKPECFLFHTSFKMFQFTKDSCILQIYALLLETSVCQNRTLNVIEIQHLVENTRNTIYFLRNAMTYPVQWVCDFIRHSNHRRSSCQCYIRIVKSFVILLHQLLRCWMQCPLNIEFDTMLQITQNGVLLLFDIFQTTYRSVILQVGGHTVQCRLQTIYNWLTQHQNDFQFQPAHMKALRLLDLRLIMDEPLKSSDDEDGMDTNSESDTAEERRSMYEDLYGDFFTSKILHQ
ncbi:ATR-interacting protein mus304 [Malaya genurostris]|uniref:ATR-interacting protein mus304 n=1 Tax=Malaya genurostris TaxID=325434 RepID=UPI0026F38F0B|nr:ATR-interacting protein mus304 [Malaya genurostris]XP_058453093.1 ATR-interacting protein mus304 [Malaya genurostris]